MPTNGKLIGSLMSWAHWRGEGLGRVVAVNGATYTLRCVDFDERGREHATGEVCEVNAVLCRAVPTPAEIAEAATIEYDAAMAAMAARYGGKHEHEPSIREIDTGVEPFRKLIGNA